MKKRTLSSVLFAAATISMLLASCNSSNNDSNKGPNNPNQNNNGEKVDPNRYTLYVKNYLGGYGSKWLYNAKTNYEAIHANDVHGSKTGVQVIIDEQKEVPTSADIKNDYHTVYFFEGLNYLSLVKDGALADITQYVTGSNPYETDKTIESKMFDDQKNFYGINENGNIKYYGLPHYVSSFGIIYNKKVFDDKLYYFVDGYENQTGDAKFLVDANDTKSKGPDGVSGTSDDGLPVTYQDFYDLCNYIRASQNVPYNYMGKNSYNYLMGLANAVGAQAEGIDSGKVTYTMDGNVTAVKLNNDESDVLLDSSGLAQTETVQVHPDKVNNQYDGYEVQRSIGKYYGMEFINKLINNGNNWLYKGVNDSYTHLNAQTNFINSTFNRLPGKSGQDKNVNIAMLIDGNWWESEASESIEQLSQVERDQLDFGWMPLPKPAASFSRDQVTLSSLDAMCFMKSGLNDEDSKLAADFIQYMNTDKSFADFTKTTNTIKCFNYNIDDETKNSLSKFGQSFWDYYHNSSLLGGVSNCEQYQKTLGSVIVSARYSTQAGITTYPSTVFQTNASETAGTYLAKMYKYYRDTVWKNL